MALSLASPSIHAGRADFNLGPKKVRLRTVTFDSSYNTGGEALVPADVQLATIDAVFISQDAAALPGYVVQYDHANQKLMVFGVEQDADAAVTDQLDQENASVDLSTLKVRILVIGD